MKQPPSVMSSELRWESTLLKKNSVAFKKIQVRATKLWRKYCLLQEVISVETLTLVDIDEEEKKFIKALRTADTQVNNAENNVVSKDQTFSEYGGHIKLT